MSEFGAAALGDVRHDIVRDFARSELFGRTFTDGMELVEETAAYLDGAGRRDSKLLSRSEALSYASASMQLTTRLMQVASWLLVQRAIREGNMAAAEACDDRYRLGPTRADDLAPEPDEALPPPLAQLCHRAERLYGRIAHLDRRMYREEPVQADAHPVLSQLQRLSAAFALPVAAAAR